MVYQTSAYKSSTGKLFATADEAEADEIRSAADALAGVEKNHLINVATGHSTCETTRQAICRLAEAIKSRPIAMPQS